MLTRIEIEDAREIIRVATPAPWYALGDGLVSTVPTAVEVGDFPEGEIAITVWYDRTSRQEENARFIAHARTALPKAYTEIDRLNARIIELKMQHEDGE